LGWVRYNDGATTILEFLNIQNSLFNAQLNASDSYKFQLQSVVQHYLVLEAGGKFVGGIS